MAPAEGRVGNTGMCAAEVRASQPFSYLTGQVGVGRSLGAHSFPVSPSVPEVKENEAYT